MTNRRRRAQAAADELNHLRPPAEHVDLPDAHDLACRHRISGFILECHRHSELGPPTSDEYEVTDWRREIADRAQDFEHGTVYLNSATGSAGLAGWYAYNPLTGHSPLSQHDPRSPHPMTARSASRPARSPASELT